MKTRPPITDVVNIAALLLLADVQSAQLAGTYPSLTDATAIDKVLAMHDLAESRIDAYFDAQAQSIAQAVRTVMHPVHSVTNP